ncbi:hypothetical protein Caci_7031 [Catenulispora acidiphila DSM 44928]|uniref:Uncharacterized protein n=1 Tax=Catenulispora acidiphila (strain DSM 44928 / JCM 14897 / NBRC 102108 / NRRL B-24433 / ID139908) TaxID=479433 RepID=C7Q592_CATAD|nr:hypothetical protein [Catenulispora acidiphila]ACU75861.1 hypothetical protein Caci_7031 [Catenulispora acidiphila DSM 44928]
MARGNRTGGSGADADGPRGRVERGRDKLATGLLVGAVGVFMAAGISACNTNPHAADVPPPSTVEQQPAANGKTPNTESSAHHSAPKPGIELPNTIQVFYATTPAFQDLTHHIVLWNATQAYKAMYAASYQPAEAGTPDLKRYWTGTGYQQAHSWAQAWIAAKQQPVGFSVLSNVVVENLTPEQATVGFCEDLSGVVRGNVQTHTPGKALQPKDSLGDRIEYSMVPTGVKGQWQVNGESIAKSSPLCPAPSDKRHRSSTH